MDVSQWISDNAVKDEEVAVQINGMEFHFRRLRSLSEKNAVSAKALMLVEKINSGQIAEWRKYAPLDQQTAVLVSLLSATNTDNGNEKLTDGLLIRMQAEAGPVFEKLANEVVIATGFVNDWVSEQITEAKNA